MFLWQFFAKWNHFNSTLLHEGFLRFSLILGILEEPPTQTTSAISVTLRLALVSVLSITLLTLLNRTSHTSSKVALFKVSDISRSPQLNSIWHWKPVVSSFLACSTEILNFRKCLGSLIILSIYFLVNSSSPSIAFWIK